MDDGTKDLKTISYPGARDASRFPFVMPASPEGKDALPPNEAELKRVLSDAWRQIQARNFLSGQPRSHETVDAVSMCEAALALALRSDNKAHRAEACRMMAYTLSANEQYADSIPYYREALDLLDSLGAAQPAARTRLGFIGALSMTGNYSEAVKQAATAEAGFIKTADDTGRARLYTNVGNLYFRREEHTEALECHRKAQSLFETLADGNAIAVCSLNLGNSLSYVQQYAEADRMYEQCEETSQRLGLHELQIQARYNRVYLHFLRGRCLYALKSFVELKDSFRKSGSQRHMALCDLDMGEIHLHVGPPSTAIDLTRSAVQAFSDLKMRYEQAKAGAFLGIALMQNEEPEAALHEFASAQAIFEEEGNDYWIAVLGLCQLVALRALNRPDIDQAAALGVRRTAEKLRIQAQKESILGLLADVTLETNETFDANLRMSQVLRLTRNRKN